MTGSVASVQDRNHFITSALSEVRKKIESNSRDTVSKTRYVDQISLFKSGKSEIYNNSIVTINRIDSSLEQNTFTNNILEAQTHSLKRASEVIKDARGFVQTFNRASSDNEAIRGHIEDAIGEVARLLNSQQLGIYIFGGADKSSAPVDHEDLLFNSNIINDEFTRNYTDVIPLDRDSLLGFNKYLKSHLDATHPAFRQLIGALNYAKELDSSSSDYEFSTALRNFDKAFSMITDLQATISVDSKNIESENSVLNQQKVKALSVIEENFHSDHVESYNKYNQYLSELTTIMKIFGNQYKYDLVNFIDM